MSAFNGADLFLLVLMLVGIVCAYLIGGAEWEKHKQSREARYYDRAVTPRPGDFKAAKQRLRNASLAGDCYRVQVHRPHPWSFGPGCTGRGIPPRPLDLDEEDRGHFPPRHIRP